MSEEYLNHIRQMPCCVCFAPGPSDPHHYGPRGTGQKTSDYLVVPLDRKCHDAFHNTRAIPPFDVERTKLELYKTQVRLLHEWIERLESRYALQEMTGGRR